MRYISTEEMRGLDKRMETECGVSHAALVQRAALRVAECVRRLARMTGVEELPVMVLAGKGYNGADARAAAEFLRSWRFNVRCLEVEREVFNDGGGDTAVTMEMFPEGTIFVDGILGTGGRGAPRGKAAEAIRWLNRVSHQGRVVAIDIPSGMDADTGECHDPCVTAAVTVCMALPKTGFQNPKAREHCGHVEVADIGFPVAWWKGEDPAAPGVIAALEMRMLLPPRPRDAHKGTFGTVGIVAGSEGLAGAATLAASGALRSGAGLVSVWTLAVALPAIPPEVMVRRGEHELAALLAKATALVVGPGLGTTEAAKDAVRHCLESPLPMVLDADGLTLCCENPEQIRRKSPTVITPHPGEAARLLQCTAQEVQADREKAARRLADITGSTVVLKGADTLVIAPGTGLQMLMAGNPGMATGGTGDVLAGLIGGLLAQGMAPYDAARLGVWLHAVAGDHAAWQRGTRRAVLTATDLLRSL